MYLKLLVLILTVFLVVHAQNNYQCYTTEGEMGICVPKFLCPSIANSMSSVRFITFEWQSACPDAETTLVCCGISELQTMSNSVSLTDLDMDDSATPGYEPLPSSTTMRPTTTRTTTIPYTTTRSTTRPTATTGPPTRSTTTPNYYIKNDENSIPLSPRIDRVNGSDQVELRYQNSTKRHIAVERYLPSKESCGIIKIDLDRLDNYPWMVQLYYSKDRYWTYPKFLANGMLISDKYIIHHVPDGDLPTNYIIGINHTDHVTTGGSPPDKSTIIEVEKVAFRYFFPFGYGADSRLEFGLLRLAEPTPSFWYRTPICLPLTTESDVPDSIDSLIFSGWENGPADLKKNLTNAFTEVLKCATFDGLADCEQSTDTTFGTLREQGGPLMFQHGTQWFLKGMLTTKSLQRNQYSAGPEFIKMTPKTIQWILDNMAP